MLNTNQKVGATKFIKPFITVIAEKPFVVLKHPNEMITHAKVYFNSFSSGYTRIHKNKLNDDTLEYAITKSIIIILSELGF